MSGLRLAISGAEGTGIEVGLLLIDLDDFKSTNDRFGHDAGDSLLRDIAGRLEHFGSGDAMAGRLGGDEFAMFIYATDHDRLELSVKDVGQLLSVPCTLDGQSHICRTSIGVARYPGHGKDADALYKNADLALYAAKGSGGGVRYFENAMHSGMQARLSQLSIARQALDRDQVFPFYQPKVDLRSGVIVGFEALLRWADETGCFHSPGLIPAAFEDPQLAIALDERIFEKVAADIARWRRESLPFGRIAINVSAAEFGQRGFAEQLLDRISKAGISASALELEVTEKVFLGRAPHKILATFERLRAAGMTIALDDFGTGFASLVHLKQFPIDVLKVDCSFVRALDDPTNAAIVQAIGDLGRRIGIMTVAEGIETPDQADRVYRTGCDFGQGYLFSPALPAESVGGLLSTPVTWHAPRRRSGRERRCPAPGSRS